MHSQLQLGDLALDVVRKDIKNVHLSVHPPSGKVRIAAPERMTLDNIRVFAIAKLPWIREQQQKMLEQERESPREFLDRESHYVWGKRYLLKIIERDEPAGVHMSHSRLILQCRRGADQARKQAVLEEWYREQVKAGAPALLAKWEPLIGVQVARLFVQRMKTKWGSCNHRAGTIRLNTDLAKKPRDCMEYILVHEMVHLIEPTHNARFIELMNWFLPNWNSRQQMLNRLPVRHESWSF